MDSINYYDYLIAHLSELQELIRIPSVYHAESVSQTAPFGIFSLQALMHMKSLLEKSGYEVKEYDNSVISASMGSGEKRIDIVSHLDVVNVSDNWTKDPFSGEFDGEYLYGRGSQDMKTSAYLVYLACNLIRESGIPLTKEIRLVYGSDEERTMDDMKNYFSKVTPPSFAFTPDGEFPICIGEKGALMWVLKKPYHGCVKELHCGNQCNSVPDKAEALISHPRLSEWDEVIETNHISAEIKEEGDNIRITAYGKSAHASRPEEGHSATVDLLQLLSLLPEEDVWKELYEAFRNPYGAGANLAYETEEMGKLTLNLGVLTFTGGTVEGNVDCRYPAGITSVKLTEQLQQALPSFEVSLPYDDPPTWNSPEDPYVTALAKAYEEVRGEIATPFISGGVSYSKVFGHCVSFGPIFPDEEKMFHETDERISLKSAAQAFEIYHKAILKLLEV